MKILTYSNIAIQAMNINFNMQRFKLTKLFIIFKIID